MTKKGPFTAKTKNLSEFSSKMYALLFKIASNKMVWSLKEVRDLLSEIDRSVINHG